MKKKMLTYLIVLILNVMLIGICFMIGLFLFILTRFDTAISPSYSIAVESLMLWYGYSLISVLFFLSLNIIAFNKIKKTKNNINRTLKADKLIVFYNIISFVLLCIITVVGIIVTKTNNLLQLKFYIHHTKFDAYDPFIIQFLSIYAIFLLITITVNIIQYHFNKKIKNEIIADIICGNIIFSFAPFILIMGVLFILAICI